MVFVVLLHQRVDVRGQNVRDNLHHLRDVCVERYFVVWNDYRFRSSPCWRLLNLSGLDRDEWRRWHRQQGCGLEGVHELLQLKVWVCKEQRQWRRACTSRCSCRDFRTGTGWTCRRSPLVPRTWCGTIHATVARRSSEGDVVFGIGQLDDISAGQWSFRSRARSAWGVAGR